MSGKTENFTYISLIKKIYMNKEKNTTLNSIYKCDETQITTERQKRPEQIEWYAVSIFTKRIVNIIVFNLP